MCLEINFLWNGWKRFQKKSISKWVRLRIKKSMEKTWPENYFSLFGSMTDKKFDRPKDLKSKNDAPREKL